MTVEVSGITRERVMERADIRAMGVGGVFIRVVLAAVTIETVSIRVGVVLVMMKFIWVEVRETWVEVIVVNTMWNWIVVKVFSKNISMMDCFTATIIIVLGEVSFEVWVLESVLLRIWHIVKVGIRAHVELNSLGGSQEGSSEVCFHGYSINFED